MVKVMKAPTELHYAYTGGQSNDRNALTDIDSTDFEVSIAAALTFDTFKELGFFTNPGMRIVFDDEQLRTPTKRVNYSLMKEKDRHFESILHVSPGPGTLKSSKLEYYGSVQIKFFAGMLKRRFIDYDIEPVNGMGFIYYLDFITGHTFSWSEKAINTLDTYISEGYSISEIENLLRMGIPLKEMPNFFGLPNSWVIKIAEEQEYPNSETIMARRARMRQS